MENYKNPTKTSFLYKQSPNRMGNMNDSPMGKSPTDMPKQGVMVNYPKGAMPHTRHAMKAEPTTSGMSGSGPTNVCGNYGKNLTTYPKYDTKSKNTAFMSKRYSFEES